MIKIDFALNRRKKHDAAMLAESHLHDSLERNAFSTTGEAMCIYRDPAYPLRIHLQARFRNRALTPQTLVYSSSMSAVRTAVEWPFGDFITYFKFLDFKKNLKLVLARWAKCTLCAQLCKML